MPLNQTQQQALSLLQEKTRRGGALTLTQQQAFDLLTEKAKRVAVPIRDLDAERRALQEQLAQVQADRPDVIPRGEPFGRTKEVGRALAEIPGQAVRGGLAGAAALNTALEAILPGPPGISAPTAATVRNVPPALLEDPSQPLPFSLQDQPQTPGGLVARRGAEFATIGGALLPGSAVARGLDVSAALATAAAEEAGAGPAGQVVAGVAGGVAPLAGARVAALGGRNAARAESIARGMMSEGITREQALASADRLRGVRATTDPSVTPTIDVLLDNNPTAKTIVEMSGHSPQGAEALSRAHVQSVEGIANVARQQAPGLEELSGAAGVIQERARQHLRNLETRATTRATAAGEAVAKVTPKRVPGSQLAREGERITIEADGLEKVIKAEFAERFSAINADGSITINLDDMIDAARKVQVNAETLGFGASRDIPQELLDILSDPRITDVYAGGSVGGLPGAGGRRIPFDQLPSGLAEALGLDSVATGITVPLETALNLESRLLAAGREIRAGVRNQPEVTRMIEAVREPLRQQLDAVPALTETRAAYRQQVAEVFYREPFIGLRRAGAGGQGDRVPQSGVLGSIFNANTTAGARERALVFQQAYINRFGEEAGARMAEDRVRTIFYDQLAKKSVDTGTGLVSPKAVAQFRSDFSHVLEVFPNLSKEVGTVQSAALRAQRAAATQQMVFNVTSNPQKSVLRRLLGDDVRGEFAKVMNGPNPQQELNRLMRRVGNTPDGQQAMRALMNDFINASPTFTAQSADIVSRSGNIPPIYKGRPMLKFLEENGDILEPVLGKAGIQQWRDVAIASDLVARSIQQGRPMNLTKSLPKSRRIQIMVGRAISNEIGVPAAPIIAADNVSRELLARYNQRTIDDIFVLLRKAATDPQFLADLLQAPLTAAADRELFRRAGIASVQVGGETTPGTIDVSGSAFLNRDEAA